LSSVTVAHADSKKADITIDKNLAMKVSSSICIRQQEASDMPVTIKRKDLEKWQLKGCRPVERLPAKTDLSADDTRPSRPKSAMGPIYIGWISRFGSEIYAGARR
jgi:hypothetical protein